MSTAIITSSIKTDFRVLLREAFPDHNINPIRRPGRFEITPRVTIETTQRKRKTKATKILTDGFKREPIQIRTDPSKGQLTVSDATYAILWNSNGNTVDFYYCPDTDFETVKEALFPST